MPGEVVMTRRRIGDERWPGPSSPCATPGIGIPADRAHRLFEEFSQVDASTTRQYGGTGLGLAISKRLAELMGGTMWVDSVEGEGSTFHFTIVAEQAERAARDRCRRSPERTRRSTGAGRRRQRDQPSNPRSAGRGLGASLSVVRVAVPKHWPSSRAGNRSTSPSSTCTCPRWTASSSLVGSARSGPPCRSCCTRRSAVPTLSVLIGRCGVRGRAQQAGEAVAALRRAGVVAVRRSIGPSFGP